MESLLTPAPGEVYCVDLGSGEGHEQGGRRPCLVVSSHEYIREVDSLVTIMPCTDRDRGWVNHVALTGMIALSRPTFVMTEQLRTVSRLRLLRFAGSADDSCLREVLGWNRMWLLRAA